MPTPRPPELSLREARRIIADPALCVANPNLRRLAWWAIATARGKPALQIIPANRPFSGDAA